MTHWNDDDRQLLELARAAHQPKAADRARVRAALASRLGAAAGLGLGAGLGGAAHATAATGAAATGVGATGAAATSVGATGAATVGGAGAAASAGAIGVGAVAAKVVGAALLVSVTFGVGVKASRHVGHPPVASVAVTHERTSSGQRRLDALAKTAAAGQISSSLPLEGREQTSDSPRVDSPPAPVGARAMLPRATAPVRATAASHSNRAATALRNCEGLEGQSAGTTSRGVPALADEAGLIHAAVVARRSGQLTRALELFDRHALLYPQGVLAEERDAERALVLAELGRDPAARAAIERFLKTHPSSPLAPRLRERGRTLGLTPP